MVATLEKLKYGMEDNIKMHLLYVSCNVVDNFQLSLDKVQWQTLVNRVIILHGPPKLGKMSTAK